MEVEKKRRERWNGKAMEWVAERGTQKIWVTMGRERKEKWGEGGEKTDLRVHQKRIKEG